MKLNTGMRCHDLCPKMEMEKLFARVREHDIRQIQLAFGKSIPLNPDVRQRWRVLSNI